MELKETAFAYNLTTTGHANPDWGAELGQGKKKLMDAEGVSDILNGMLYYKIDNIDDISAVLGRGNQQLYPLSHYAATHSIVLASVIQKVSVNGNILPNQKLIMFVTKDERTLNQKGGQNDHYQRRYLKFSDKAEYQGVPLNRQCFDAITQALNCTPTGSWIVTDMNFVEDVLDLTAFVVDPNNSHDFASKADRSNTLKRIKHGQFMSTVKPSTYSGDLSSVILYGPPGTGKTHKMQADYISKFDEDNRFITTFHQSFSYEEFVEGLKPVLNEDTEETGDIKYTIEPGIFKNACERAAKIAGYASLEDCVNDTFANRKTKFDDAIRDKRLVLLCIDEINRGNVAAIFGDLISLIEDNKRLGVDSVSEMMVNLPYSKEKFGVPANLVIVGTMNTADRSIQLLDSALRRRFKFIELLPDYSVFRIADPQIGPIQSSAMAILKNINSRIRVLLNKDNQIGHAYLMSVQSEKDIFIAVKNKIIPLLEEYFYNEIYKVRYVLNEDVKQTYAFYEEDKEAKKNYLSYTDNDLDDDSKSFYELKKDFKESDYPKYLTHLLGKQDTQESQDTDGSQDTNSNV